MSAIINAKVSKVEMWRMVGVALAIATLAFVSMFAITNYMLGSV